MNEKTASRMSERRKRTGVLASWLLLCLLAAGCGARAEDLSLAGRIGNAGAVVAGLRQGLRDHAETITVTFDYGGDIYDELNAVIDEWVEAALVETGDPAEGDYIRYQYGGYTSTSSYSIENGRWRYTVELVPVYYTHLSQEEAVTEAVGALLADFAFDRNTSDYEKLHNIYDYLCRTVTYDKVHRKNPYARLRSTAYAALVRRTATCQGYCAALYRLLRESGVDCRIVTGTAAGEDTLHAWVIAELDGVYYNLDPTWDAGRENYQYFLAGAEDFTDHIPSEQFLTAEFMERYPIAARSYGA